MSSISPAIDSLLDRLARIDPAEPKHDPAAVERALGTWLAALDLPPQPFFRADDVRSGYRRACHNVWRRISAEDDHASPGGPDPDPSDSVRRSWSAARDACFDLRFEEARTVGHIAGSKLRSAEAWRRSQNLAMAHARAAVRPGPLAAAWRAAHLAARDIETARRDPSGTPAAAHYVRVFACSVADAVVESLLDLAALDRMHPRPPFHDALAALWLPLVDAFEAGLFALHLTWDETVYVLRPTLSVAAGRLHRADGPAVTWPSGEAYHFWRGVEVPAWIIEEPERLGVPAIRREPNQEIRRCMIEIFGTRRYLREAGARRLHRDRFGTLWQIEVDGEIRRIVEVVNATPEPDGTRRIYTLDVTEAEDHLGWPVRTARAAVAATYGLRPEDYSPQVRT